MLMSDVNTCLCNLTHRNCVALAILIGTYQLVNDYVPAEVVPASVFARLWKLLYRKFDCNLELQRYTADKVPLQAQSAIQFWLDRESSYKRLSQLALDLVASPASQAYAERLFSLCGDLTARKRNRKRMSLYRRVFLKLNRHILHWTQCTVNWSVTCF